MKNESVLLKWHYQLYYYICKLGTPSPKRHGQYWNTAVAGHSIHMDDYNKAITIDGKYFGMDFGGFSSYVNEKTYKYFVGLLYQKWLLENHIKLYK